MSTHLFHTLTKHALRSLEYKEKPKTLPQKKYRVPNFVVCPHLCIDGGRKLKDRVEACMFAIYASNLAVRNVTDVIPLGFHFFRFNLRCEAEAR